MNMKIRINQAAIVRRNLHDEYALAMSEGRRQRAVTFRPKKGKGSYKRTRKHRGYS